MKTLYIIPARGGSKGIPNKNIKEFNGKPLIYFSIDVAREFAGDEDICVTTDSDLIKEQVEKYGLKVPFRRPDELSTDEAGSYEVIMHAIKFYEEKRISYKTIVLLQPTSPLRKAIHLKEAMELYHDELDMVVSVKEARSNPYFNLAEENEFGYLEKSKIGKFTRRQDCPKVYEYNGAVYILNVDSLKKTSLGQFKKVKKYVMDEHSSVDIDTMLDWEWAEFISSRTTI